MAISAKQVEQAAFLARLQLSPEELSRFAPQMDEIVRFVEKLKAAPVEGVIPTTHVLPLSNVLREDETQKSLTQEEALSNAPQREGPFFKVPRIIESG